MTQDTKRRFTSTKFIGTMIMVAFAIVGIAVDTDNFVTIFGVLSGVVMFYMGMNAYQTTKAPTQVEDSTVNALIEATKIGKTTFVENAERINNEITNAESEGL